MKQLTVEEQNELIAKETERLHAIFEDISDEKKEVAESLIERVAFMTITLKILEDDIKNKGPTYLFENGKQRMYVENPSQKSYSTMINRYTAAYGKLFDLLPKETQNELDDGFDSFVNKQ